ncbi:MAG: DNA polymerase III subunit delta, partial [bacterium]|nr:DNA polymerase III subunit delta [bacterium]
NVYRLAGEGFDLSKLKEAVEKNSIFETKKLIILDNFFKLNAETLKKVEDYILARKLAEDSQNLLIFCEEDLVDGKQKSPLFKVLTQKPSFFQKFEILKFGQLKKWTEREILARGGKISASALEVLALNAGGDLWRLDQEINKLIAYKMGDIIEADDVKLLTAAGFNSNIFELIDALGRKEGARAFLIFSNEIKTGRDELEILSLVAGHFRRLISVRSMVDSGRAISASLLGFHQFVFQKILNQSRNFTLSDLKNKFRKIVETDYMIKTGKIDKRAGLEMLIFSLGK